MNILSQADIDLVCGGLDFYMEEVSEENIAQLRRPIGSYDILEPGISPFSPLINGHGDLPREPQSPHI